VVVGDLLSRTVASKAEPRNPIVYAQKGCENRVFSRPFWKIISDGEERTGCKIAIQKNLLIA
jgi:hypothetical protein